jgi:hypothetical protein
VRPPQNLVYYDVEPYGSKIQLTYSSIVSTLESIVKGTVNAKHSENFFERTIRVSTFRLPTAPLPHCQCTKQSINNGLVILEDYVVNHVMTVLFIGFLLLIAFVQFIRKALSDTVEYPDGRGGR